MKKSVVAWTVMVSIQLMFGAGAFAGEKLIKIGDAAAKTYSYFPACMAFKEEVEKASQGRLKVEYFGDATLGNQKTLIESARMGAIQMTIAPTTVTQNNFAASGFLMGTPNIL